ncbi:MAG: hypothetical protein HY613_09090, partial [Candidatus Rokubacteria bacterium]|nr:hypothetical protein [Candidatus Rokubacteria bacterium]
ARGLIALGRMGASREGGAMWLELLDGISIEQSGTTVNLRGSIAEKTLAALAQKAEAAVGQEEPAPPSSSEGPTGAAPEGIAKEEAGAGPR